MSERLMVVRQSPATAVCAFGTAVFAVGSGALLVSHGRAFVLLGFAIVAVVLARVSPAIPAACAGLPTLIIGLLGHDPFPAGTVRAGMFLWGAVSIGFYVRREAPFARLTFLNVPVLATVGLVAVLALATTYSSDSGYGWFKTEDFVGINVLALALALCFGQTSRDLRIYCWLTLVIAVGAAAVLLHGLHSGALSASVGGRYSIADDEHPIELGRDAGVGILIALYLGMASGRRVARYLAVATIPVLGIALFSAGSRGPVLALAFSGAAFAVLSVRASSHRRRLLALGAGAALAAAIVPRVVPAHDLQRAVQGLVHGMGASSNGRAALWAEAWRVFGDHPWAGVGTGGFAALEPLLRYPHNFVLELAAETGALGLALAVAAVCAAAAKGLRLWAAPHSGDRLRASFICALLAAAVVNGCLSGDLPINAAIWTAMGLACAAAATLTNRSEALA